MSFLEIGASLLGSMMQSDSAGDAADAQRAATEASVGEQRRQFDLTRTDYAPYRNIGTNALRRIAALYGINDGGGVASTGGGLSEAQIRAMLTPQYTTAATPARSAGGSEGGWEVPAQPATVRQAELDAAVQQYQQGQQPTAATAPQTYNDGLDGPLQMDPGYQFGMQQGQQALDRKIAASGGRVSGASLKAAQRFGTDYATTGYGAAYQRRQDSINRLASLAGIGQSATGASAAAGSNAANNISSAFQSQGDATAAAGLARGNIWGNALNQGVAAYQRSQPSAGYWPTDMGQSWSYDK